MAANGVILIYGECLLQTISSTFSLLLGSCLLMKTIANHIKEDLVSMDKNWKTNRNSVELRQKFGEAIENHANAVQLSTKY